LDSTSPEPPSPSILVVEVDKPLREDVSHTLKRVGYEVVLAGTGEEALDLIAADFDGLYCEVQLPGEVDGWEVGTTFSFIWPHKPTVYASALASGPPGRLRNGVILRKPFALDRLARVFGAGATAARARQALA
jgi:CheY-like chemotaxis protein